jgi:hypothetical protein
MYLSLQRLDPERRVAAEFIRKVVIYSRWVVRHRDEERSVYAVICNTWQLFCTDHKSKHDMLN